MSSSQDYAFFGEGVDLMEKYSNTVIVAISATISYYIANEDMLRNPKMTITNVSNMVGGTVHSYQKPIVIGVAGKNMNCIGTRWVIGDTAELTFRVNGSLNIENQFSSQKDRLAITVMFRLS